MIVCNVQDYPLAFVVGIIRWHNSLAKPELFLFCLYFICISLICAIVIP